MSVFRNEQRGRKKIECPDCNVIKNQDNFVSGNKGSCMACVSKKVDYIWNLPLLTDTSKLDKKYLWGR